MVLFNAHVYESQAESTFVDELDLLIVNTTDLIESQPCEVYPTLKYFLPLVV